MSYFYPFFGLKTFFKMNIEKHNDVQYCRKHLIEDYPGTRGIVTNIFQNPCLIIADTSLKKDFFVNKQRFYTKHPLIKENLDTQIKRNKESIILAEGESWKRIRRIISKTFNYDFILSIIPIIISTTNQVFDKIKDLENANIMEEFQKITGNVILKAMMGEDFLEIEYKGMPAPLAWAKIITLISGERFGYINFLFGKKYGKFLSPSIKRNLKMQEDFIENFMMKYIKEKFEEFQIILKKNPDTKEKSLLESMFKLILKKDEDFILEEVLSNILILFIAGTDTTGHLLAHLLIILEKNPNKFQKLMEEIDANAKEIDSNDYDTIKNLEYLNSVIKEGLRMVNPAPDIFLRKAIADHKLCDLVIKKGTNVLIGLVCNFFDPSIFKKPFEFLPERWIKGHELFDNAEEKDPYSYLPFSAGARNCIGQHMAIIEAKIILVKFLRRFQFQMKMKEPITWIVRFVIEPKDAVIAKLIPR